KKRHSSNIIYCQTLLNVDFCPEKLLHSLHPLPYDVKQPANSSEDASHPRETRHWSLSEKSGPARSEGTPPLAPQPVPPLPSSPTYVPALGDVLLNKVQMCLSGDASVGSKALARVLSAVPTGDHKGNSFASSLDLSKSAPEESEPVIKHSSSTKVNAETSSAVPGKMQF
ncbi:hypothetical protein DNTS_001314, partial [Danionella cerebrum]